MKVYPTNMTGSNNLGFASASTIPVLYSHTIHEKVKIIAFAGQICMFQGLRYAGCNGKESECPVWEYHIGEAEYFYPMYHEWCENHEISPLWPIENEAPPKRIHERIRDII